ncbi:TldE-like protein, partial [archaeon]|nr:TldE-like protein [archaeon]
WNVVLANGDHGLNEMIRGVKKGLYVTNVWYTRFQNYATGDFSTIPRDGIFLIENGEIVKPLKEIRITDNVIKLLKNVTQKGKEIEQIYSWETSTPTFTPAVAVKDVNITKPH